MLKETQCQTKIPAMFFTDEEAGHVQNVEDEDALLAEERVKSNVPPVEVSDTMRCGIHALAQTYIDAYDKWWSSLVCAPYNERKNASHAVLDDARRQAFLMFGAGIAEARKITLETN